MISGPTVRYEFAGKVWFYTNPNAVYFVSLPKDMSADILELVGTDLIPWGTVPCEVTFDIYGVVNVPAQGAGVTICR